MYTQNPNNAITENTPAVDGGCVIHGSLIRLCNGLWKKFQKYGSTGHIWCSKMDNSDWTVYPEAAIEAIYPKPQKDGLITRYEDGTILCGGWSSRLKQWRELAN